MYMYVDKYQQGLVRLRTRMKLEILRAWAQSMASAVRHTIPFLKAHRIK